MLPESGYYAGRRRLYCSNRCKQKAKRVRRRAKKKHFVSLLSEISGESSHE
jgi:hypothetical protein